MIIKIKIEKIKKPIHAIQNICQKKTISELTQNILLEIENKTLILKATDLEIFVEINIDIEQIIKESEQKKILINARILYDIIKEVEDEEIEIHFNTNNCNIKSKQSQIELNTIDINNFPQNELRIENILHITNKNIIECIAYCSPLSTIPFQKNTTATILFEIERNSFKATSTDGHCLSHIQINKNLSMLEQPIQFLLSKKASSDIKKIIETINTENEEIFIGRSNQKIIFTGESYSISVKTINEKFPDYKKIITTEFKNEFQCQRGQFIKIAKRLSLFTENKFIPANMIINKEKKIIIFKIENNTIGKIEDEISIDIVKSDSNELTISIFPPYILKAATEINLNASLQININEKQRPILFSASTEQKSMLYVVMPMVGV
jgi:DNA polymerase-3 subunit beta